VAYDLIDARDAAQDKNTTVVRIEQLYPFPSEPLVVRLKRMKNLETVIWAQEEPQNNGAWDFVRSCLEESVVQAGHGKIVPTYAGRSASASPATGLASRHKTQQAQLVADALGHGK
jgi:2-oxoglutarate dehydrogenase E1 component